MKSVDERKKHLIRLKESILNYEQEIYQGLKDDLGKSAVESYLTELGFILEEIKFVIKNLSNWSRPKKVKTPINLFPGKSYIYPEPYGTVLIISPWNYPFQLCFSPLIGAIAAGNRVVLKPSEFTTKTSMILKKIINEVFSDQEVLVIEGGVEETQRLLKQKFDYIFFTGSTSVGRIVMKAAAEFLTPVTLELGGKSPVLITDSADLNVAAKRCAWGKFTNAGQTCVAPDYVLIPEKLQEEFISLISHHIKSFYFSSDDLEYGKIINQKNFDRLLDLIIPEKVAVGGNFEREKLSITPTILKNISWSDKIMKDEIFGPILPIIPYSNINEAITSIKNYPKPLAFYLFGNNKNMNNKIIQDLSFGGGCINDTLIHLANPYLPFGGVGDSGMGSYHGRKSFETFSHMKSVFHQSTWVDIPLRYPPYKNKLRWLKFFMG
ncbi:MAG: aldehyde dehydrogenase [Bacteriovoracaceae bacterium]